MRIEFIKENLNRGIICIYADNEYIIQKRIDPKKFNIALEPKVFCVGMPSRVYNPKIYKIKFRKFILKKENIQYF